MIFGKHINRYYLKNAPVLILGVLALILVDYFQLRIPELYRMLVNGMNGELILVNGEYVPFNLDFLLDNICLPIITIIVVMVIGRFLWRVCFYGSAIRVETDLRNKMFKSQMKTTVKKFNAAVESGDKAAAAEAYKAAVIVVDKAAKRNIIHKNAAAHKKSQFTVALNKMA